MRKSQLLLFFLVLSMTWLQAQPSQGAFVSSRSMVEAYDDEAGILKLAYRNSPYFIDLVGDWTHRKTDSSIVYSRELEVEKFWKDYCVSLNVRCGRACRVMLNGKEVGYADDSRHWNEFALNDFLKYGKMNMLTIEALDQSQGALLENSRIPLGMNGDPYLLFKGDPNVSDLKLVADYDVQTLSGTLSVDASIFNSKKKGKYYLEVEVLDSKGHTFDRMGRWVVFDNKNEVLVDMTRTWSGVEPWTAEKPVLYTVVCRLRNEKMEEEELVGARFGFRRVEVKDGLLQINGTVVTLKGVIIDGDIHGREMCRQHILNLKDNNINAVRTAKFSPLDSYFYELCDEYGLYVICDANLQPASSQHQVVATDKDFIPLFEHRVENLYGKYKNHASIIAWSLGDTRDNGICMAAAYKRLKSLDRSRPIVFSGADFSESTDIIALNNPSLSQLRQAVAKKGERPVVVLSATKKGFYDIWDQVTKSHTLQGTFVDDWSSQALTDLKNLYSPFDIHLSKLTLDEAEFNVYNKNDFTDFSSYILEYTIYTNLRPNITAGDLPLAIRGGGVEAVKLQVPPIHMQPGEEMFIRFDLTCPQKAGVRQSSGSNNMGTLVFSLSDKAGKKKMLDVSKTKVLATFETLDGRKCCRVHTLTNEVAFNLADGTLEWFTSGLGQMPIDSLTLFFENHRNWKSLLVALTTNQPSPNVYVVDAMLRYYTRPGRSDAGRLGTLMCDVRQTYTVFATGDIVVDYTVAPSDQLHETLVPRVEIAHSFGENDTLSWFGLDREIPYGQCRSAIPGTYRKTLPHGMIREENRWCAINDSTYKGLFIDVPDTHFTFMADTHVLWITPSIANHSKPSFRLHLRGFSPKVFNISSTYISEEQFEQRNQGGEHPRDFIGMTYPQVSTGMLEPPVITASEARFSAPLIVTITSNKKSGNQTSIRYTLDGSEPSETSILYDKPFTLTTTTMVKAKVFDKELPPSFTASHKFNYDYIVKTTFSQKPNTPFNVGTDTLLFDGEKGMVDDLSRGWLGFSGNGVTTMVELSKSIDIDAVTLRFAHFPEMWAFAPKQVTILLSSDGQIFSDTVNVAMPFDPLSDENNSPQVVELKVPVEKAGVGFLKIVASSIGTIPVWHRAKGLKPWLMIDEIEVSEAARRVEPINNEQ